MTCGCARVAGGCICVPYFGVGVQNYSMIAPRAHHLEACELLFLEAAYELLFLEAGPDCAARACRFVTMASTGSTPVLGSRGYQGIPSDISIRGAASATNDGFRYFQPFLEESEEEDAMHASVHSSVHNSLPRGYGYR